MGRKEKKTKQKANPLANYPFFSQPWSSGETCPIPPGDAARIGLPRGAGNIKVWNALCPTSITAQHLNIGFSVVLPQI